MTARPAISCARSDGFGRIDDVADGFQVHEALAVQAHALLGGENRDHALLDAPPGEPPALHRGHHGVQMAASGSAGISSASAPASSARTAASARAEAFGDAAHLQRVGHHQAFEAQLVAQQVREDGRRKRGGQIGRRQRGHGDVRGHDGIHARFDGRAERHQFHALQPLAVGVDGGQVHVRIDGRVAVARKMFGGGQHEIALVGMRAFDEGLHVRRHFLRDSRRTSGC